MSAVVVEDFVRPYVGESLTKNHVNILMRGVVVVFGGIYVCLVFVVEHLGAVFQVLRFLSILQNDLQ